MEFLLGYLVGSGANWLEILAVFVEVAALAILIYNIWGIE